MVLPSAASSTTAVARTTTTIKTMHSLLGIAEHMELSQIVELIYRAEGNANLVVALPQFKKVLRLPKMLSSFNIQQQTQEQQQQQQHQSTSDPNVNQNAKVENLTMVDFVAYIEIMRQLLGNEHIFETDIVNIPKESNRKWINQHIKLKRPAHRRDKEFCGQFGLLLPDATHLPKAFDILLSNLQPGTTLIGDTYSIEIKPKQGWLFPTDVDDLFDITRTTTETTTTNLTSHKSTNSASTNSVLTELATTKVMPIKSDTRCRYCAMQFLKLQNNKIAQVSSYCPIELFSGVPSRMLAALHALFTCPQNNLRIFTNGNLIYGDHADTISWEQLVGEHFQGEKLELIKHLLVTCLLRDYSKTDEIAEATNSAAAVAAGIATAPAPAPANVDADVKAVVGQPLPQLHTQSSATESTTCNTATSKVTARETETATAQVQVQAQAHQPKKKEKTQAQISEVEMLCLPKNCILQKILHLQLLAKQNLRFMFESEYAAKSEKSYTILRSLFNTTTHNEINFQNLQPLEQYILGATALDCSIMLTLREIPTNPSPSHNCHTVYLPKYKKSFLTKVTLVDLDPKPDSHFHKYLKQTRKAYNCCKMLP